MARIGPATPSAGHGRASMASRRTPASCATRIMRTPTSRVRAQRASPLCASLAITTGACANPHWTSSSTEHQPSTTASFEPDTGLRRAGAVSDRLHGQQGVEVSLQNVELGGVAVDVEYAVDHVFALVPTGKFQLGGGDVERRQRAKLGRLHLDIPGPPVGTERLDVIPGPVPDFPGDPEHVRGQVGPALPLESRLL